MNNQDYQSHVRYHPLYHFILTPLVLVTFIISIVHLIFSIIDGSNIFSSVIFLHISIIMAIMVVLVRSYSLKAQDRAIRAEENLRHYVLTGELLDVKLDMGQVIALRFADNKELPALSKKAAEENLKPNEIKKMIQSWRADYNRI
ncbi:DUF6526 family protein [Bacillus sp. 03113]|uniref:DUF6526 family protein n=1 Tax=Bacillus sp. 03113 TaxID=2578211 RepID=UPI0011436DAD|nr:DUF6526 family protein [Bacillus sp. 03113]